MSGCQYFVMWMIVGSICRISWQMGWLIQLYTGTEQWLLLIVSFSWDLFKPRDHVLRIPFIIKLYKTMKSMIVIHCGWIFHLLCFINQLICFAVEMLIINQVLISHLDVKSRWVLFVAPTPIILLSYRGLSAGELVWFSVVYLTSLSLTKCPGANDLWYESLLPTNRAVNNLV